MHLHAARITARQDGSGGLLLLEEQDRTRWDQQEIQTGLGWLAKSADGDTFSRYHAEAGIAAEHCLAPSFDETRWDRIVECYALLERLPSAAEPFFVNLNADVTWCPAMNLEDLKAGLEKAAKH